MLARAIHQTVVVVLGLIFLVPLVWIIFTSFTPSSEVITRINPFAIVSPTFSNYVDAWETVPFLRYYSNTIIIVGGVLVVQLITATLAAYAFARLRFIGQSLVFILFLVQIMIPAEVLIFPNYTIIKQLGLVDTKLAVMLPFWASSFGVFLLRQTFKQIPIELDEASKVDGCQWWRTLWHVYFPSAKPTYVAFALISISTHWSNFMWPLIVTNSVENRSLTVGLAIFAQTSETGAQWGIVTAATLLVVMPLLLAFFVFQRQFVESFMHTGLK
ncbi:carbohydrate ABC transporter permease [Paenibacillus aceris]|uniref:Sn-glycerol 3-phosphate transport system permease protein n=1 Tax=Paenibacillus aceris TaxID=869555 RepID=A0ABS4I3C5_9BACL|nr:carbohydrate ABC transporter permease [Paenibacillus aceris]MBP1965437.1 sn-glycerol 3-phosphate transport system permease protein [Paenibacillus aceris]NHW33512.1 carbohydrate ABC transporter permease [Paenibacillus aceris]